MPEIVEDLYDGLYGRTVKKHIYIPEGHAERKPRTVLEVLKRAKATLQEEQRWMRHADYKQVGIDGKRNREVAEGSPFCGSWRVCARGAVQTVVLGAVPSHNRDLDGRLWRTRGGSSDKAENSLYGRAMMTLNRASGDGLDIVTTNDSLGFVQVMAAFDKAIKAEEDRESAERAALKPIEYGDKHYRPLIPAGFDGYVVDAVDALERAREVLAEEGRWVQQTWFANESPMRNPEDPFCNSWKVCAEGAVGIVTIGCSRHKGWEEDEEQRREWSLEPASGWLFDMHLIGAPPREAGIYRQANEWLSKAGAALKPTKSPGNSANYFNDYVFNTRTEVLAWFDKAIELAKAARDFKGEQK